MKVAQVIKRIEAIDDDIKQLQKLMNQLRKGRKYTTPIIITIEQQINILLGERTKYFELKIENPPPDWDKDEKEKEPESAPAPARVSRLRTGKNKPEPSAKSTRRKAKEEINKDNAAVATEPEEDLIAYEPFENDDQMLTQKIIDEKWEAAKRKIMKEAEKIDEKKKR